MSRLMFLALGLLIATSTICVPAIADDDARVVVRSPSAQVEIVLEADADANKVVYSVRRAGKPVVEPSPIVIRLADVGSLASGATISNVTQDTLDETSALPWGKSSDLRNHCGRATVRLKTGSGVEWNLELRAYDDGVAWRYSLPEQDKLKEFVIAEEATEFRLAGDPSVLFMTLDHFTTSHEALYQRKPLSKLPAEKLIETPILAVWPDGSAAAIHEARLRDFAGMYLERRKNTDGDVVLRNRLAPLPSDAKAVVKGTAPHDSSWRVVLLADQAGRFIESSLLLCLNEPATGDFSWAKPGKTTFNWWNGPRDGGLPYESAMNFETQKHYIDFCVKHGIRYHAVVSDDRPWHVQSHGIAPTDDTDILTPRPELELPKVIEYANEKGIALRFWVHWKPLSEKLEEAFDLYEEWGITGLMVDFMDRNDQEMVQWQEKVLESAARHKLHIQFHGSYPPSGEQRTFPNLFNREGVLNLEYLKWTDHCTPAHNVNVAYTRALAGPTDYHAGGFRSATRREFESRDQSPLVLGTRAHHLAIYVVYENPMPMVADSPSAYEDQPGFDFVAEVPTTWDETRFVAGEAGEYIVVARRKGDAWYLGGMTNWTPRELALPLEFLGEGTFEATFYVDGEAALRDEDPNAIRIEKKEMTSTTPLKVSLGPGGGVAAVFRAKQ